MFKYLFPSYFGYYYLYSIGDYKIFLSDVLIESSILIVFALLNLRGIKFASKIQNIMVILLISIILVFGIVVMEESSAYNDFHNILDFVHHDHISFHSIYKIVGIAPWAFIGFDCIYQLSEECRFDTKKISFLTILSIVIGALLYLMLIWLSASGIDYNLFVSGSVDWATAQSLESYLGKIGLAMLGVALSFAVIAGLNAFYLSSSRLLYALSKDQILPSKFSKLNQNNIPGYAILFVLFCSLLTPFVGRVVLLWIVELSSLGASIGYFYTSISALISYYQKHCKIQYLYLLSTLLSIVFIVLILLNLSVYGYLLLIIWSLIGLLFYCKRKHVFDL